MVVTCEEVWREVSNYLEDDIEPALRSAMEEHFRGCPHCTAVLDGTRNVIEVYGDERMFELPVGFSQRLRRRLEENMPRQRGTAFGWIVAVAAAALVAGSFELGRASANSRPALRSEHAQPGSAVPADMMVVVAGDGKTFHAPGCTFIHEKEELRTMTAGEAVREGYAPCVRCMRKYLKTIQTAAVALDHVDFQPAVSVDWTAR
jgi:Putative zinc-finger